MPKERERSVKRKIEIYKVRETKNEKDRRKNIKIQHLYYSNIDEEK